MGLLQAVRDLLPLERVIRQGGKAAATIVIAWVIFLAIRRAIRGAARRADAHMKEEAHRQRVTTLLLLLESVTKYVIIFFAGIMVLRDVGVDPTPLLAGAGIAGLAVGFGAQNLVRDVVSGFFIIMEGQYAVGDLVELNGVFGRVERVGLRMTRVRDLSGKLRYLPNGSITRAETYTCDYVAHTVTVPLPPDEPADPVPVVQSMLEDFDREFKVFAEPAQVGPVENLTTYARVLRVETRSVPGRESPIEQKLPTRLAGALERAGHSLPAGTEISVSLRFPPPVANA